MIGVLTTPPLNAPSNGWLPKAAEGRPFLPTALLIFHRETLPFFHLLLNPSPTATSGSFYFLFYISPFCFCTAAFPFMPWNYARCILLPLQTVLLPSFFLFWYLPMLLSPSLWPGSRLSCMATRSRRCSKVGSLCFDWSGRQEAGVGPWRCTRRLVAVA